MANKVKILGAFLALVGLAFVAGGIFTFTKVQAGAGSLQAFSQIENVTLPDNEDGQLVDRGKTEGADAIMKILKDDWKYPVNMAELDPNDPLVNTGTEYMYQMATITHHVTDRTVTVTMAAATVDQRDHAREGLFALDKVTRAVHGIDHPARLARAHFVQEGRVGGRRFLADDGDVEQFPPVSYTHLTL